MALAQWLGEEAWTPEYVSRARQLIDSDSLLHPTARRRLLEAQAARIERHRPFENSATSVVSGQSMTLA
jgi:hypothetical protein